MSAYTVSVRMEVQIDRAAWEAEYGTPGSVEDFENYLQNHIDQSAAAQGGCFHLTAYAVHEEWRA